MVAGRAGNLPETLRLLNEALTLARTLGDRQQEADLLWYLALGQAEMGQREQALGYGQAAVDLLEKWGKPQARVFREHLEQYRRGEAEIPLAEASGGIAGGLLLPRTVQKSTAPPDRKGPSYLRMAVSAASRRSPFRRLRHEDRQRWDAPGPHEALWQLQLPHRSALPRLRLLHQAKDSFTA